jgi:hypothetical protein
MQWMSWMQVGFQVGFQMAEDVNSSSYDKEQLSKAVGYSRKCLNVYRQNRIDVLKQLVGNHYSGSGADDKVPINLLELSINIYMQRLAAQAPQAEVTTDYPELKEICTRTEISGNQLLDDMNLGETLQMAVMGGLICLGVVKTGLNLMNVEVGGEELQSGKAFAAYVSLDDWVQDMTATDEEGSQYEGNFYYVTIDEAEKMFPKHVGKFAEIDKQTQDNENKAHDISEGSGGQREEYKARVRLIDIYLKKEKKVLRCSTNDDDTDPLEEILAVVDWSHRKRGPYHKLAFMKIDNNAIPVAPAMHWRDIHDLSNRLFRKLGRQADRQKTVTGVRAGSDQDGNRIVNANDGDMIKLDDPQGTKEYKYGGIQPETLGFLVMVRDLYSYMAGNLDVLGGLGPQSETLGQDKMINASASMRMQKMQLTTVKFVREIIEDIYMYMWEDPLHNPTVTKKVKGFEDVAVQVPFGPEDRQAEFIRLNIDIEPYSMQHTTPEAKLQGLRTIFTEFVAPFIPMMQSQGIAVDFEQLFRKIGKLGNLPELNDILIYSNPQHEPQPQQAGAGKPATTTRNYNRRSIPGASNAGKSTILQQALFGKQPQKSETDSLMRATG